MICDVIRRNHLRCQTSKFRQAQTISNKIEKKNALKPEQFSRTFAPIWFPHCPACRWTISRMFACFKTIFSRKLAAKQPSSTPLTQRLRSHGNNAVTSQSQSRDRVSMQVIARLKNEFEVISFVQNFKMTIKIHNMKTNTNNAAGH